VLDTSILDTSRVHKLFANEFTEHLLRIDLHKPPIQFE